MWVFPQRTGSESLASSVVVSGSPPPAQDLGKMGGEEGFSGSREGKAANARVRSTPLPARGGGGAGERPPPPHASRAPPGPSTRLAHCPLLHQRPGWAGVPGGPPGEGV